MEINKYNFKEKLPIIKDAIQNADFISIDGEFTGISTPRSFNQFDTPEERYGKLKEYHGSNYLLIQFGLCTFHYIQETKSYRHKAFNFYIFPCQDSKSERPFLCQPSSIGFLVSQGFDFNKVYRDGIPFLNANDTITLKNKLHEKHRQQLKELNSKPESSQQTIPVPNEHIQFIKNAKAEIKELLSSKDRDSLDLGPCDKDLHKLVDNLIQDEFTGGEVQLIADSMPDNRFKLLRVEKKNQQFVDYYLHELQTKQKQEIIDLNELIGFSKVIQAISDSEKLVVGHNMLLDILNIVRQFVIPLPDSYKSFKELVKCTLNYVVDTKLIANSGKLKNIHGTSLPDLLNQLKNYPFNLKNIEPMDDFKGYVLDGGYFHEAGYDAFITGSVLISLHQNMCKVSKVSEIISQNSKVLKPFLNKVYLMYSNDIAFLDFDKEEEQPSRNHVFHVTFPKGWTKQNLIKVFKDYGHIFVSFLNDTHCYLALKNCDNVHRVCQDLVNVPNQNLTVIPYNTFKNLPEKPQEFRKHKHNNDEPEANPKKLKLSQDEGSSKKKAKKSSKKKSTKIEADKDARQLFTEPEKWE